MCAITNRKEIGKEGGSGRERGDREVGFTSTLSEGVSICYGRQGANKQEIRAEISKKNQLFNKIMQSLRPCEVAKPQALRDLTC